MINIKTIVDTKIQLNILNFAGVYFLIKQNEIIYVGSAIQIGSRLLAHRDKGVIPFDSFNFVKYDDFQEMRKEEKRIIATLMPKYNFYHNPNRKNIRHILFHEVINKYKKVSNFINEFNLESREVNRLFDLDREYNNETLELVFKIIAPNGLKKGKSIIHLH